jgi:hypothetical protein
MSDSIRFHGVSNDLEEAVQARMRRQEVLYRAGKRFHFVLTEAALRYRFCPLETLIGQLDRLVTASSLPSVLLGIIPFEAEYHFLPHHGFVLYDERIVLVETIAAELSLTQPQEIDQYVKAFEALAASAAYGREARVVVTRVLDDITATDA